MVSLFKIFLCCSSSAAEVLREEAEEEETNHNEIDEIIHHSHRNKSSILSQISQKEPILLIDERYLSQIERERIKQFTSLNIISFINEMEKENQGKLILKTDNIELYVQIRGSPLSQDVYFGKTIYSFPKEDLIPVKDNQLVLTKDFLASLV